MRSLTGADKIRFSVPTGNFGDIFAGYVASQMGVPIGKLVLATNENDILARFFTSGVYRRGDVVPTLSPSMDIQIASNFERYLYYKNGKDSRAVIDMMSGFAAGDAVEVGLKDGAVDPLIAAGTGTAEMTLETIKSCYAEHKYLLDPHSAVGYRIALDHLSDAEPMVSLATAHPAKFGNAIEQALGENIASHPRLDVLHGMPSKCDKLAVDVAALEDYVAAKV
jgi:threonine synthase